jgi:hypothetical protein
MQGAITHLIAGVPVSELGAATDWYTRLFGRPPDLRAGEEILWDIDEHATLFIEPDAARAGSPSPLPDSTRSWRAWLPKVSNMNQSRLTRTVSVT